MAGTLSCRCFGGRRPALLIESSKHCDCLLEKSEGVGRVTRQGLDHVPVLLNAGPVEAPHVDIGCGWLVGKVDPVVDSAIGTIEHDLHEGVVRPVEVVSKRIDGGIAPAKDEGVMLDVFVAHEVQQRRIALALLKKELVDELVENGSLEFGRGWPRSAERPLLSDAEHRVAEREDCFYGRCPCSQGKGEREDFRNSEHGECRRE